MVNWFLVDQTIAQLGFYLTTTSQFALITLTLFFLRKSFGAYKYLIVMFSVVGLAFASCEFLLYPVLHSHNAGYFFFTSNRPLNVSNKILVFLLAFYTGLYSTTISLLAVQYIYRYFAVFDKPRLKYFKGLYFYIWPLYASWFGVEWAIGLYKGNEVDDYSIEYMREVMMDFYGNDVSETPSVIHVVYQTVSSSTERFIRWKAVACTVNMAFIMLVQYGIMMCCGYKLYTEMEEKIKLLSAPMRRMHRQIFKTLVLQIATPTIVLFSPIVFVIVVPYFDLDLSMPTGVFLSGFTLYPALDAFILMSVVTDYRKAFLSAANSFKLGGSQSPA